MKVSLRWLKDYVDFDIAPLALADRLTMAGLEVDAVEEYTPAFTGVVTAKILSMKPHPGADKLHLLEVTTGEQSAPDRLRRPEHEGRRRGGARHGGGDDPRRLQHQELEDPGGGLRGDALLRGRAGHRARRVGNHDPAGPNASRDAISSKSWSCGTPFSTSESHPTGPTA